MSDSSERSESTIQDVVLRDVGPIRQLRIPIPRDGGVVVLRGRNGQGKSHALCAVDTLLRGKGTVETRDGAIGALVEGFGARLTVSRRSARAGEIEVDHIEGADPFMLVDPMIKDPNAADAARVREMLRLAGAKPSLEPFAQLVGGMDELRRLARPATLAQEDVVSIAGSLKRDLQGHARNFEEEYDKASRSAQGLEESVRDVPVERVDSEVRRAHEDAVVNLRALETSRDSNRRSLELAAEARKALEELGEIGTEEHIAKLQREIDDREDDLVEITRQIEQLQERRATLREEQGKARSSLTAAKDQSTRRARMQRALDASSKIQAVDEASIEEARRLVAKLREEVSQCDRWEAAEKSRARARELREAARVSKQQAENLRFAAQSTDSVVAEALAQVCPPGMSVADGRIHVQTDRSDAELFSELSHGERTKLAFEIAIRSVGEGGVIVGRQEGWEALDPIAREAVAEQVRNARVTLITAQADDGELRAEVVTQHDED